LIDLFDIREEGVVRIPEFEEIFEDRDLLLSFREFLYRRIANENLAFWIEVGQQ
jgi:hypothetical protein